MDENNRIHIALTSRDLTNDYSRHAGVTLLSILEHSKKPVVAHILYDESLCAGKEKETEYNKRCYQKIADKYNCRVEYHHVDVPDSVKSIPTVKKWTTGTLFRLHLAELLPHVTKIIYFDTDMVVNASVDDLWDIDLNDTCFGACLDTAIKRFSKKRVHLYETLGIPVDTYFCTATLILNLEKLRETPESFTKTVYQFLVENPALPSLDQDLVNWYCQGKYTRIPAKYNIYATRPDALNYSDDAVVHYAGDTKPWMLYSGKIDLYYWKYAIRTPWLENIDDLVTAINSAPNVSLALEYAKRDFLHYLSGTKPEKAKSAINYIGAIILSCFKGCIPKRRRKYS